MPYREPGDPNAEAAEKKARAREKRVAAIKKMRTEIVAEEKFSIQLPEDIKANDAIPLFEDAVNNPHIGPEGIAFYSIATGILKYKSQEAGLSKTESLYIYKNPNNDSIQLTISLNKKEHPSATVFSMPIEKQKPELLSNPVRDIKKMIETATDEELRELKIDLEPILFTINDKLKRAEK